MIADANVLVSAITPTYNRGQVITRTLDSILAQSRLPDEIILVDDGSTDGTADIVRKRYGSKVRVIEQKNGGVSKARARGISEARGKWIAFLDSDDQWLPGHLQTLLDIAENVPEDVAWIFGDTMTVVDGGETQTLFQEFNLKLKSEPEIFADSLTVQFPFQFGLFQSSLIRRSVFEELNCFREGLRTNDDLLVGFQVACKYRFAAMSKIVTRLDRTSSLRKNSVELLGRFSREHYQSRMLAFALAAKTGRPGPWRTLHSDAVRGLCLKLAAEGRSNFRWLAMQQLRFGISGKALAFCACAMLGRSGAALWNRIKNVNGSTPQFQSTSA
jgi:glycosyltransferase involved in cell wall biosynthesis